MRNIHLGIICAPGHELDKIILACNDLQLNHTIVDINHPSWKTQCENLDGFLIRPPCNYQEHKGIFDEVSFFLTDVLKKDIYPSFRENYIYENKRCMDLFLSGYQLPKPKTIFFMNKESALKYLSSITFPIVSKSNTGASGSGVKIIKNKQQYIRHLRLVFGRFHPELSLGWAPKFNFYGLKIPRLGRSQKHYLLLQEYIDIKWEWRLIRIGDAYMGHQKLLGQNGFASGSELVGWSNPPKKLLHLLKDATDTMRVRSMAMDVFESKAGQYYVNELQPIFGAHRPYQMKVDGKPGVYYFENNDFIFKEGSFCQNACWNLRIEDFLKILR